ncbi:hypothetical protein [Flavobacterium sp.]
MKKIEVPKVLAGKSRKFTRTGIFLNRNGKPLQWDAVNRGTAKYYLRNYY